ncbi:MAG: hypothetical protein ABIU97_11285 [Dehalococcoidia bacterium]
MTDSFVRLDKADASKKIDAEELIVNGLSVFRLRVSTISGAAPGGGLTDVELRASAVPVSGPLTDAQLRVAPVPVSGTLAVNVGLTDTQLRAAPVPVSGTLAVNVGLTDAQIRATALPVSMAAASVLFKGRACTFRTLGRAGTTGQKLLSLHNATGSPVKVTVTKVFLDLWQTVVKLVTVAPPIIRLWKVTALPTNGSALTKNEIGGTTTSSASVTVLGDASADGTGSATTLTATLPAGTFISQQTASRMITAAGYEMADRIEFLENTEVTLNALEGLVVFLDYVLATQNPVTDMWLAGIEWSET